MDPKEFFQIDPSSQIPLAHQIKENLREVISSHKLEPEDMLPSERELAALYGVGPAIVRQAVNELVQEGLLHRVAQFGTFVAAPKVVQVFSTLSGFSARMRQEGHMIINRVLSQEAIPAPLTVAQHLRISEGAPVIRLVRLRIVDHEPLLVETSFLSLERFPDLLQDDFAVRSLYEVLSSRYDVQVLEVNQTLEPVLMTKYDTELLEGTPGSPAMLIETVTYGGPDDPFEFSRATVRGDKCRYYFRVSSPQ